MRKAVAYIRTAITDQIGVTEQRNQIESYAAENNISVVEWIVDENVSGVASNKRGLLDILDKVHGDQDIEILIVARKDRISRRLEQYNAYKAEMQRCGVKIMSATEDSEAIEDITGYFHMRGGSEKDVAI